MATPANERPSRPEREMVRVMLEEEPDEAASIMESAKDAESAALLEWARPEVATIILRRLTPDRAARVLAAMKPETLPKLLALLNPNRVASLFERLDPEERDRCLGALDPVVADELRAISKYPPDTAGSLMDPRVTTFRTDATVRDVVRRLRQFRNRRIQDIFLVDGAGHLAGAVALQDVVLSDPGSALGSLLTAEPIAVKAIASREEVTETFETHRLASLPVVDFEGHILGVLRQRELVQAAQESATASAVRMFGASGEERALSSPWFAVRKRLPWLQVNLVTAFLAASVVGLFEDAIGRVTALAVLLPVVAGQSGNTGAQALAVTMRGLALREVRTRNWLQVVTKEAIAGASNGVAVAITTAIGVYAWSGSVPLGAVIGVSMVLSMAIAGLAGAAIPMGLTAIGQDPAQSSSIILTTVTDVAGFFSFLGIASACITLLE